MFTHAQRKGRGSVIHCSQINLQHCKAASALLFGEAANSLHTYIHLIQEPYCPFGKVSGVPSNSQCHVGKIGTRVRAIVLVSKDLPALTLRQFSDEDCVSVLVELNINGRNEKVVFCSLYLPYDSPDPLPLES